MKKHFAIFLCIVIGYVCADLQRVEIGEDDSKADQDARKAASLDVDETITEDQAIRSKDVLASAQSSECTSNESEDSDKLSSAAKSISMTSEAKKVEQRAHSGILVAGTTDPRVLLKHSCPDSSAENYSIGEKRSFHSESAASMNFENKMTGSSQAERTQSIAERKTDPDHRDRTNFCSIDGLELEDFETYGNISHKVRDELKEFAEQLRWLTSKLDDICHRFEMLVQNASSGYCNELKNLHSGHPAYFQAPADLVEYSTVMMKQIDALALYMYDCIMYLLGEQTRTEFEEGTTKERLKAEFERPRGMIVYGTQSAAQQKLKTAYELLERRKYERKRLEKLKRVIPFCLVTGMFGIFILFI